MLSWRVAGQRLCGAVAYMRAGCVTQWYQLMQLRFRGTQLAPYDAAERALSLATHTVVSGAAAAVIVCLSAGHDHACWPLEVRVVLGAPTTAFHPE